MRSRVFRIILVLAILSTACATRANLASTATPGDPDPPTALVQVDSTPTQPGRPSPTAPRPTSTAAEPDSTHTPAPTVTPVPESHWHWAIHPDTGQIVAINQFGEAQPVGEPRPELFSTSLTFPLDTERALMLVDDDSRVSAYVLTPEALEPVQLPANVPYDAVTNAAAMQVVGSHGEFAAFWYRTFGGSGGDSGTIEPPHGPLLVVNLTARTAELVDPDVNTAVFDDPRAWIHPSADGRYLRFLAGSSTASRIRELDLNTGLARTIYELTGKVDPFVRSSSDGSGWLIGNAGVFLNVTTGVQTALDTDTIWHAPLGPDSLLSTNRDCVEPCGLQVVDARGEPLPGTYQLPFGQVGMLTLLLPGRLRDGAIIVATTTLEETAADPTVVAQYPDLDPADRALFRLNPDGTSDVLGILPDDIVFSGRPLPFSVDGRYGVLLAPDRSALRLLDLRDQRTLAEVPLPTDVIEPTYTAQFFDPGIYVTVDGQSTEGTQQGRHLTYLHATGVVARMDEAEPAYTMCNDLLPDGSILCWHYADWTEIVTQFVRYAPDWSQATLLLDDHAFLEVTR